ncbi:MAG: zinc metalloprotease [Chitinophagaceae bacterium]
MKKLATIFFLFLFAASCQKHDATDSNVIEEQAQSSAKNSSSGNQQGRACAADEVLQANMAADPSLRKRMDDIESFTRKAIASGRVNTRGTLEIPVVVHVIWNSPEENISDAQIQSQIDVLNEDFNLRNRDNRLVPSVFSDSKAEVGISFKLVQTSRVQTKLSSWQITDGMKYTKRGGSDAVDPLNNLNIWVVDLAGYLGYAQFPGGDPATDGIVVDYFAFGRMGNLYPDYNKGRTATHEIGHWLNLRHIWGDTRCGTDYVDDTPFHTTYNFGCPKFPKYNSCATNEIEMTMNYMDYTDDPCMYMFSNGQKSRMLATFVSGGPRATFAE